LVKNQKYDRTKERILQNILEGIVTAQNIKYLR